MAEPEIGEDQNRRQLVLITGLAGAGRSTALNRHAQG